MKTRSQICIPTPLSLFCAVLLCLPLALVFTIIQPPPNTTTAAAAASNDAGISTILSPPLRNNQNQRRIQNITTAPQPPSPPTESEEDDDEKLFRRAAAANPNPISPMKVAFMFLTATPLPFAPLWEIYFNQTTLTTLYNIYVHADPGVSYDPPFSGVFENRVIPGSKPTRRYSPTLISAARRLISHALLDDPSNYMFALLSPSCIPIHSFNFTYNTLIRSRKSFIEVLKNERGGYERWAVRGKDVMLPEMPFDRFRIGSQFFVLTRQHARIVVKDKRRLWSKFKLPCLRKYVCYPEEQYFPSLISMKSPGGYVPATLTRVDWRGSRGGHPRMYTASDVTPELILGFRKERPRYGDDGSNNTVDSSSYVTKRHDPFLFARKFSPDSLQPLLRIAKDVIFKD